MSQSADFSEVEQLARDLGTIPGQALPFIRKAMEVTAIKVAQNARGSVIRSSRNKAFRNAGRTIDYDILQDAALFGGDSITAEVGYAHSGVGLLGVFRELGTATGQAAHLDLAQALHNNTSDLDRGLSRALADGERQAGL